MYSQGHLLIGWPCSVPEGANYVLSHICYYVLYYSPDGNYF